MSGPGDSSNPSSSAGERPALPLDVVASTLYNEDLAPTLPSQRTWNLWHIASLWVGMSVCATTYTLASSLLKSGMNWWQAAGTILLGNLVVTIPMCLNGHPGTKHGIPFPVLSRASFGTSGSNVPALARAIVACGWFGIQTWLGGAAVYELLCVFLKDWKAMEKIAGLGINAPELGCFLAFWAINVFFILKGTESIKWLETLSAPFLIAMGIALLGWGVSAGGGSLSGVLAKSELFTRPTAEILRNDSTAFGLRLHAGDRATRFRIIDDSGVAIPTKFMGGDADGWVPLATTLPAGWARSTSVPGAIEIELPQKEAKEPPVWRAQVADDHGHISSQLVPAKANRGFPFFALLTAMVGYWATLSLNIPDFTRFARSQRDQVAGQLLGLPTTMAAYSFIGIAVTCASLTAFPDVLVPEDAPWDPVRLLARFQSPVLVVTSMIAMLVATLTTNIAANVVSPANDFSNLAPRLISYKAGGMLTAVIGILMMPWKLLASSTNYVGWLLGYSALLGPIAGIMIADYFVTRRTELHIPDLYRPSGRYGRWNAIALLAFALAVAPCVPGFLVDVKVLEASQVPQIFLDLYTYAWFVGFGLAFTLYAALTPRDPATPSEEPRA